MHFLVVGVDGPGFDADPEDHVGPDVGELHQTYMDGWSDALVARGPLLTPDGETHAGSVHVVDLLDLGAATGFASEEPFASAGWYSEVTVAPLHPLLPGTMWDRPRPAVKPVSSFVRASSAPGPGREKTTSRQGEPPWLYLAAVLSEDGQSESGLVGLVDLAPDDAVRRLASVAATRGTRPVQVTAQRWQRGGRHQDW
jgi:uncharacterized protein